MTQQPDFFERADTAYENRKLAEIDARLDLHRALRAWLSASDAGGITRKQLMRVTVLEAVTGDKGGNLRRWLGEGANGANTYVPTMATLEKLSAYLVQYGFDVNAKKI